MQSLFLPVVPEDGTKENRRYLQKIQISIVTHPDRRQLESQFILIFYVKAHHGVGKIVSLCGDIGSFQKRTDHRQIYTPQISTVTHLDSGTIRFVLFCLKVPQGLKRCFWCAATIRSFDHLRGLEVFQWEVIAGACESWKQNRPSCQSLDLTGRGVHIARDRSVSAAASFSDRWRCIVWQLNVRDSFSVEDWQGWWNEEPSEK